MTAESGSESGQQTEFQKRCVKEVERLLRGGGLSMAPWSKAGVHETYLVTHVVGIDRKAEIYVYEDEAGLQLDSEWKIWERPDFSDQESLRDAFLRELALALEVAPSECAEEPEAS